MKAYAEEKGLEGFVENKAHYEMLTNALKHFSFSLLETPPPALAELDNPYDTAEREETRIDGLWDAVYYQGKYYCYFGIVPVLTLFLPWRLITGYHLFSDIGALFFAFFASLGLVYCFIWIIQRWFSRIPAPAFFISLAILLNTCGFVWCVRHSLVYEVALLSESAFLLCGLALNMRAVSDGGKGQRIKLYTGCLLMALSVGCRPTSIFISLVNVPLLIILLSSGSRNASFWVRIKNHRRDLLSALIPYGIVGAFLGYYNYARFGFPFEFGRTYQLSLVDARVYQNGLPIPSWLIGIANFIFGSGANLISSFPFIKPVDTITFGFAGYKELNPVYSAILLCPLILFIPFVLLVLRRRFKGKGAAFQVFFSCLIILSFLLAGFCGASAGTLQRYMLDFYWMIILAGLLSAFLIGEWLSEHHTYQILAFVLSF